MKKIVPVLIILSFVCIACKKEPVDPGYGGLGTISAKIDGDTKTFNTSSKAILVSTLYPYEIRIEGYEQPGSFTNMVIRIVSPHPIVPGTYTNDPDPAMNVQIIYYEGPRLYGTDHDSWEQVGFLRRTGTVTISEISNSSVKGTFSATLFYSTFTGTDRANTLSNGIFNVSF